MTLPPFFDIDALINQGCAATLANAVASYQGGAPFGVILDSAPADPFNGVLDASSRICGFDGGHAPGIVEGSMLLINGAAHRVAGGTVPDETGWLQLQVFPVA
ncbi:hypothetical protein [Polaromonas sp. CG_23.6]|uniref:hypothetical protein n=1 Tax=Polaromonas sp. CG_23.6 TaxID=2760709 RepID=UPI00247434F0|nr:hypothetical protein [Polaromonas sp. CG_23.6]MDH6185301.1 hypothetical protein [Polaromonas sp. CG_23.6]